jgi:hypothetical protein
VICKLYVGRRCIQTRGSDATVESLVRDIDHFLNCEPLEARPDSIVTKLGSSTGETGAVCLQ